MSNISEVQERLADMTASIIPADQWPEGAVALVFSDDGWSNWLVADSEHGVWYMMGAAGRIPMPAGWDWRVPVMRNQPGPDIDLDLVREAVEVAIAHAGPNDGALAGWQRLLALIDGQAKCVGELSLTDALSDYLEAQDALDNWETAGTNRDLYESVMARRNAARRDLESAMQPTKGEGE